MHGARGNRATKVSHRPLRERRNLLRLGAAGFIPEMLEEHGIKPGTAFGRSGISRRPFADPDRVVPLAWLAQVFESAAIATAKVEFGLLVGLRAGARLTDTDRGKPPNDTQVSAALMAVISRPNSFPNSLLSLSVSGDTCTIEYVGLPSYRVAHDQLAACAMGFAAGAVSALCGPRWHPRELHFAQAQPPDPLHYAELLQAPVSFDAHVTTMVFESTWLGRRVATPQGNTPDDVSRRRPDLAGEARAIIASWRMIGRPSATAVASELGLKPRTLNRLLGKEGTSFIRMLEDAQYESAQRLLRDATAPVVSVAWSLGYADASAFSRAFRRWSGMTPTEWRQAAESGVR